MREIKIDLGDLNGVTQLESGMIVETNIGIRLIVSTSGLCKNHLDVVKAEFFAIKLGDNCRVTSTLNNSTDALFEIKRVIGKLTI